MPSGTTATELRGPPDPKKVYHDRSIAALRSRLVYAVTPEHQCLTFSVDGLLQAVDFLRMNNLMWRRDGTPPWSYEEQLAAGRSLCRRMLSDLPVLDPTPYAPLLTRLCRAYGRATAGAASTDYAADDDGRAGVWYTTTEHAVQRVGTGVQPFMGFHAGFLDRVVESPSVTTTTTTTTAGLSASATASTKREHLPILLARAVTTRTGDRRWGVVGCDAWDLGALKEYRNWCPPAEALLASETHGPGAATTAVVQEASRSVAVQFALHWALLTTKCHAAWLVVLADDGGQSAAGPVRPKCSGTAVLRGNAVTLRYLCETFQAFAPRAFVGKDAELVNMLIHTHGIKPEHARLANKKTRDGVVARALVLAMLQETPDQAAITEWLAQMGGKPPRQGTASAAAVVAAEADDGDCTMAVAPPPAVSLVPATPPSPSSPRRRARPGGPEKRKRRRRKRGVVAVAS